jgi:hypothetical protein
MSDSERTEFKALTNELYQLEWDSNEFGVIQRIIMYIETWSAFIPKNIEYDIIAILKIAIKEKKKSSVCV